MGRLSARSNPTGVIELERSRIGIDVSAIAGTRGFTVDRLEVKGTGIADDLHVIVVARAGNSSERFPLGAVATFDRTRKSLALLDASQPLSFRVLIHPPGNPGLVASLENIRPRDDTQSESILPMEPADLGERLWKLVVRDDGPILQFNSTVFPSAAGTESFLPFSALVLPEALHAVLRHVAENPEVLDDDGGPWSAWNGWLDSLSADRPPADGDEGDLQEWCERTVDRFCSKFSFASRLRTELERGIGND